MRAHRRSLLLLLASAAAVSAVLFLVFAGALRGRPLPANPLARTPACACASRERPHVALIPFNDDERIHASNADQLVMLALDELERARVHVAGVEYELSEALQFSEPPALQPACGDARRAHFTRYARDTHSVNVSCAGAWELRGYTQRNMVGGGSPDFVVRGDGDGDGDGGARTAPQALPRDLAQMCVYCADAAQRVHMQPPGHFVEAYEFFHAAHALGGPPGVPLPGAAGAGAVQPAFNVLVVVLDASDALRMPFYMPRTYELLRSTHAATQRARAAQAAPLEPGESFESFWFVNASVVGQGSWQNGFAFYKGCLSSREQCWRNATDYVWQEYQRLGFVTTVMAEAYDFWPDKQRTGTLDGVDYYRLGVAIDKRAGGCVGGTLVGSIQCTGGSGVSTQYLGYWDEVRAQHADRAHFGLYYVMQGHVANQRAWAGVDDALAPWLERTMRRGDTVVVLMSDHGLHYTPVRRSPLGVAVHTTPTLAVLVPRAVDEHVRAALRIDVAAALRANQARALTHLDTYTTLAHLRSVSVALGVLRAGGAGGVDGAARTPADPVALPWPRSLYNAHAVLAAEIGSGAGLQVDDAADAERMAELVRALPLRASDPVFAGGRGVFSLYDWVARHAQPMTASAALLDARSLLTEVPRARPALVRSVLRNVQLQYVREPFVWRTAWPRTRRPLQLAAAVSAHDDALGPALAALALTRLDVAEIAEYRDGADAEWRGYVAIVHNAAVLIGTRNEHKIHVLRWERRGGVLSTSETEITTSD